MDLELPNSSDVVPRGVTVAVKHFLQAPKSSEEEEVLDLSGDSHTIVKILETDGSYSLEVIDTFDAVTSQYFETDKFQNSRFCYVTSAWLPWVASAKCNHSSLKKIVITQDRMKCPHEPYALSLHCVCLSVMDEFKKELSEKEQVITRAIMTQNIEHSSSAYYHVSVRLNKSWESTRSISHLEMCKYGGQRQLGGSIKESFGCNCEEVHCARPEQIFLKVREVKEGKSGEENDYDTALFCNKSFREVSYQEVSKSDSHSKAQRITKGCNSNEVDVDKIIMRGLVQPSNPGAIHVTSCNST